MGEPFAGDIYLAEWFQSLHAQYNFYAAIETGTHEGDSAVWFAENFPLFYTCENVDLFFQVAKNRLSKYKNAYYECQSSVKFLENILPKMPLDQRTFIFLDAHWGEDNPLSFELEIICKSKVPVVIAIHDFCSPSTNFAYDKYKDMDYDWKSIEKYIENFNKPYKISYNTKTIGACVGCIVIEFEEKE